MTPGLDGSSTETWVQVAAIVFSAVGLALAILRAGARAVASSASVAANVRGLTETVRGIDGRVETYIRDEVLRTDAVENWRRAVDARLAAIEARLAVVLPFPTEAPRGRRRGE